VYPPGLRYQTLRGELNQYGGTFDEAKFREKTGMPNVIELTSIFVELSTKLK